MNTKAESVASASPPAVPPLSQSRQGDMACETLYVFKHVQGGRVEESEPAARGIEIHRTLAAYLNHLVRTSPNISQVVRYVGSGGEIGRVARCS